VTTSSASDPAPDTVNTVADSAPGGGPLGLLGAAVAALGGSRRAGQHSMTEAVDAAMRSGEHVLVQAGTGTGKSLAYLVPSACRAAAGDGPVIVATATLALQAQLVDQDLPRLAPVVGPALPRPLRWATLKGRANYACLHRVREGVPDDEGALVAAEEVVADSLGEDVLRARDWAEQQVETGGDGDRDRLDPGVPDRAWAQVSVSARECLGAARCPYGQECFAERARARAADVDVVVTNHALLAIDAMEEIPVLPEHHHVVVDEAHELAARVTGVVTAELVPGQVERAARRAATYVDDDSVVALTEAAEVYRSALADTDPGRLDELPESLGAAVARVRDAARTVQSQFRAAAADEHDTSNESARRNALVMVDEAFGTSERIMSGASDDVVWAEERDRGGRLLRVAPMSVAGLLRERLFAERTVTLTSATMEVGGSFEPIAATLGLKGDQAPQWSGVDVGSPFDYRRQAIVYVARHLPPPGRDGVRGEAMQELTALVAAAGGRTLGLFSSRRAAEQAAEYVRSQLPGMPVLCQGEDLVPALVRRFKASESSCLFGTLSLWQGVDVPGPACQLVVIDRIPFPRPDDPLQSARARAVEQAGGNGFMTVSATHAALLLAQGTGRLIRHAADRGVVALLDPRMVTARYGPYLRASIPPMWFTTDRDVVLGALRRLDGRTE